MPKEKKFRQQKPNKVKNKYIWNIGDIYAYQLKGEKAKKTRFMWKIPLV